MTNQIFVFNTDYESLIKLIHNYIDSWKESDECKNDYNSENSIIFTKNFSSYKSYSIIIIPVNTNSFVIIDSIRSNVETDLAKFISNELKCDSLWISIVGNSLYATSDFYNKGVLSETIKTPQTDDNDDSMPMYQDIEQFFYDKIATYNIPPEYRLIYFDHLENIKPCNSLLNSKAYLFKVQQKKTLFSSKFILEHTAINFNIKTNKYPNIAPAFPSFIMQTQPDTIFELLILHGKPSIETSNNLIEILNKQASRHNLYGYTFINYNLIEVPGSNHSIYNHVMTQFGKTKTNFIILQSR